MDILPGENCWAIQVCEKLKDVAWLVRTGVEREDLRTAEVR